jgi:hypothetical protein
MRRTSLAIALLGLSLTRAAVAGAPRVIPWLDAHPPRAPANPPLALPCRTSALRAQLALQGATGSLVGGVELTNAGRASCSLVGWPQASLTGPGARSARWRVRRLAASPEPPDTLVDPPGSLRALARGKIARVALFWSNWCGTPPPLGLRLGLPGGTSVVVSLRTAPRCDDAQAPSTLSVAAFAPAAHRLPPSSRLSLHAEIVGVRPLPVKRGLRAFRVARRRTLRYLVALTNTGTRVFRFARSSCPAYVQQLVPSVSPQAYVLNCRPAAPVEPGLTLRFEMLMRIPADAQLGNGGLSWELAPRTYEPPFATAAVVVTP